MSLTGTDQWIIADLALCPDRIRYTFGEGPISGRSPGRILALAGGLFTRFKHPDGDVQHVTAQQGLNKGA